MTKFDKNVLDTLFAQGTDSSCLSSFLSWKYKVKGVAARRGINRVLGYATKQDVLEHEGSQ